MLQLLELNKIVGRNVAYSRLVIDVLEDLCFLGLILHLHNLRDRVRHALEPVWVPLVDQLVELGFSGDLWYVIFLFNLLEGLLLGGRHVLDGLQYVPGFRPQSKYLLWVLSHNVPVQRNRPGAERQSAL